MGDVVLTETEYNVTNINAFVIIMNYHPSYLRGFLVNLLSLRFTGKHHVAYCLHETTQNQSKNMT